MGIDRASKDDSNSIFIFVVQSLLNVLIQASANTGAGKGIREIRPKTIEIRAFLHGNEIFT